MIQQGERANFWEERRDLKISDVLDVQEGILFRLRRAGILTMGQLGSMTEEDLRHVPRGYQFFGEKTIQKIQAAIVKAGFPRLPKY